MPAIASVPNLLLTRRMHYRLFSGLLVSALLLSGRLVSAAESADELMEKGKAFEQKFDAKDALPLYLEAEKLEPKNCQILVRIARQYRYLMTDASGKEEKLRLGNLAQNYSERAAAACPNDCDAQLAPAITLGKMLPYMPTKQQISSTPKIKASAEKALQINPDNDTAWHILGRWNRVLAEVSTAKRYVANMLFMGKLPKGSNEEAERDMKKALALNPKRLMHYIELGRIYAQMGRKDDARQYINKGLAMPNMEKDDPETKERGRETLQKL